MKQAAGMRLSVELLSEALSGTGISIPPGAVERLILHAEEMLLWNRSIRLTSITAPDGIAVKHMVDSLLLLLFSTFSGRTLDFGSGAGYPGIPLAIVLPEVRFVLLESSAKKCAFLSRACSMLGLSNAEVVRGRLTPKTPLPIGRFEQIVTRATLPPVEAARLLVPYLSQGGRLLLMTGPGGDRNRAIAGKGGDGMEDELPSGAVYGRRERFVLPLGMGSREIREIVAKG